VLVASGCARLPHPVIDPSALTCRVVVPDPAPSIAWIEPADARSRAAAPRWCATVGPVVFDQGALTERPPSNTLTVITWNVHVGGGDIGELLRLLARGDFTEGEAVDDYVLLLQEVRRRDERVPPIAGRGLPIPHRIAPSARAPQASDLSTLARDYGLSLLYVPAMRNGTEPDREDRGNAILSTRRLDDVRILELPFEHQRRIVPIATVAIGSGAAAAPRRVRVATVHFDTSISLRRGGPFAARRREATALVEALRSSDIATVAAGDFTTWAGDEGTIALMRRAFPDTPRVRTGSTFRGPLGVRAALDHVFVRAPGGAVTVRRLPNRFGSDHYPVLARLRF
jgi:endonuclease/exonuclease/phosphatase family metal-dependent hydrolase